MLSRPTCSTDERIALAWYDSRWSSGRACP